MWLRFNGSGIFPSIWFASGACCARWPATQLHFSRTSNAERQLCAGAQPSSAKQGGPSVRRRYRCADRSGVRLASGTAFVMIVARLLEPAAKLATARMLAPATASHSLGEMLGLGRVAAKEVYAAL